MAMELVADRQASPMMTVARDVNAARSAEAGLQASFSSRAALSFRISGRTLSLISIFSKSESQRSGAIIGQSEPKRTFVFNSVLEYCTRIFGKYFGDQPDRSI